MPVKQNTHQNQVLELVEIDNDNIICPRCTSSKCIKRGFNRGKQQYCCKDCNRFFVLNPLRCSLKVPEAFCFNNDIWNAQQLGIHNTVPHRTEKAYNFTPIQQEWLKYYAKQFILHSHNKSLATRSLYLDTFKDFSRFLYRCNYRGQLEEITRSLILDYIYDLEKRKLSYSVKSHRLYQLKTFFDVGKLNNWFNIDSTLLIYKEDYPKKTQNLPRYIPKEVMHQLNHHLSDLPDPMMRMVLIIQECGLRIGELCQLSLDCLKCDKEGQWRLQFMQWKLLQEHTIPISSELAQVIREQQNYIFENLTKDFKYLFCASDKGTSFKTGIRYKPSPKIMKCESFIYYLRTLSEKYNIKDSSGQQWHFTSHQFRHTVGTSMINSGVPQYIVQRYLGHTSPEMTMTYAHIYDETLRKEIEKYHESRVVNFQGETAELDETVLSSNDDLEWFKKNVQAIVLLGLIFGLIALFTFVMGEFGLIPSLSFQKNS